MNRLRHSLKGSSAAPAKQELEPDFDPMMEDNLKRRPAPELDLQLLSDDARIQFADIIGSVDGPKDIVIQQELMSLLDHVTPIAILKR